MRVALVHDWLTGMRGGERVLEALLGIFPDADLFTLVHARGSVVAGIEARPIHTSWLNRLPAARRTFRCFLPAFPGAIERFRLQGYDLVISSSHCVAKGIPTGTIPHLCYCHTPMRYVWDAYDDYFGRGRAPLAVRALGRAVAPRLRAWDVASARRVHAFVANSRTVQQRIRRHYGRTATVVYPPVAVDRFHPAPRRDDSYLVVSALVPYKRVDLVIDAFRRTGRRLIVVGDGPELGRLHARAGPHTTFTGRLEDDEVARLMGRCRALVVAAREDFGIATVEAQASGAPVVAFAQGGSNEIVRPAVPAAGPQPGGATGLLFPDQSADSLIVALDRFEQIQFNESATRANAARFSPDRFRAGLRRAVDQLLNSHRFPRPSGSDLRSTVG